MANSPQLEINDKSNSTIQKFKNPLNLMDLDNKQKRQWQK